MAITECGNGHVYDSDQYASCPYCNGANSVINFDGGGVQPAVRSEPGKTMAPSAYMNKVSPAPTEPQKTVAPDWMQKKKKESGDNPNKTVAVFKKKFNIEPVVGWLACISGPEKGKSYQLWAKINTIGRSDSMDVCIREDPTISKENHARLAYDPKHNGFQIIPGQSVNNIYLNDEPLYIPMKISAFDTVELGDTKLIFVPLCCDKFQWETEAKQEDKKQEE